MLAQGEYLAVVTLTWSSPSYSYTFTYSHKYDVVAEVTRADLVQRVIGDCTSAAIAAGGADIIEEPERYCIVFLSIDLN